MTQSSSELLRLTMVSFEFLQRVDDCELEVIEVSELLTKVAYKFGDIAVQLSFDWRDLDVTCFVARLSDGRMPEGYLIHDGRRVRYRLGDLTPEVLRRFKQLPRPSKRRESLTEWASWQFDRMADAIRIYA